MKKTLFFCLTFLASLHAAAQRSLLIQGTLSGFESTDSIQVFVSPIDGSGSASPLSLKNHQIRASIVAASQPIYNLSIVRQNAQGKTQFMLPIYLNDSTQVLQLQCLDRHLYNTADKDNRALSDFANFVTTNNQQLWNTAAPDTLLTLLRRYPQVVDSLLAHHRPTPLVAQYLRLWSYDQVLTTMNTRRDVHLPFSLIDVLGNFSCDTDQAIALNFPSIIRQLLSKAKGNTLSERLEALYQNTHNPELRQALTERLLDNYVLRFPYKENYEAGLIELQTATQSYALDQRYIQQFKLRRATLPGTPFPKVKLIDTNGNPIDFAQFRGYYVYIDLWASWCAPCVREIPHLQRLEHELNNKKVKFVSISIDTNAKAWREKMEQLQLSGHQYLAADNGLSEALNISGIPHFLIYDPEGNLLVYKAQRPSSGESLKNQLEALK